MITAVFQSAQRDWEDPPPLSQSVGDRWCEQRGGRWLISAAESRSWSWAASLLLSRSWTQKLSSRLIAEQISELILDSWIGLCSSELVMWWALSCSIVDQQKKQFWKSLLLICCSIGDQQRFWSWSLFGRVAPNHRWAELLCADQLDLDGFERDTLKIWFWSMLVFLFLRVIAMFWVFH